MIEGFEELNFDDYDKALERLVPFLNSFASKKGKEGRAYFVGEDFIVKSIVGSGRLGKMTEFFDCYIKEQQKFANQGLLIPKLYSYKAVKSSKEDGSECVDFYILEERFKGSDIFVRASKNFFDNFKRSFGSDQTGVSVDEKKLAYDSMKNYIDGFISQNNFLMSLSDDKFDDLTKTVYRMFKEGKYSIPDVHAGNLLVNKDGFNVIDNYMVDRASKKGFWKRMTSEYFLTTRYLNVFRENVNISSVLKSQEVLKDHDWSTLYHLQEENMFYTGEVIKKLMISAKRCLSQNEEFNINTFVPALKGHLHRFLDVKQVNELAEDIEKGE